MAEKEMTALGSGADGDWGPVEEWGSAEEFNAMLDEVSGYLSACDSYEEDFWFDEIVQEESNDNTLPPGEMELIFANEYVM